MERVFKEYDGLIITHKKYKGVLCGYNEEHFIIAVEGNPDISFRKLPKSSVIPNEEYKTSKYRYIYENESEIIKQANESNFKRKT